MRLIIGLIFSFLLFTTENSNAQRFKAAALGGINLSQVNGDGLAGYHKWGLTAGMRVSYEVYDRMDLSIEMLFNQKGSRSTKEFYPFILKLNYIDIPLVYSFKDWYQDKEKYYKTRLDLGLSYGYLFSSSKNVEGFDEEINNLETNEFSFLLGAGYNFTKNLGMSIRYTRALSTLYFSSNDEIPDLVSYFLSIRTEYTF